MEQEHHTEMINGLPWPKWLPQVCDTSYQLTEHQVV